MAIQQDPSRGIWFQHSGEHDLYIPRYRRDDSIVPPEEWRAIYNRVREFYTNSFEEDGHRLAAPETDVAVSRNPREGFVYLLILDMNTDPLVFKIGKTADLDRRSREIDTLLPWPVYLYWAWRCSDMDYAERKLHERYAHRRMNGEWFALTLDEAADITSLESIEPLQRYIDNPALRRGANGIQPDGGAAAGHPLHERWTRIDRADTPVDAESINPS